MLIFFQYELSRVPEILGIQLLLSIVHGYFIYYKCVYGQVLKVLEILGNSYYNCQSEKNENEKFKK
jgi:hypothetical protein